MLLCSCGYHRQSRRKLEDDERDADDASASTFVAHQAIAEAIEILVRLGLKAS